MTQTLEIRTIDLPSFVNQLHRQSIGVDRMFNELQQTFANSRDNYPPHNVINLDDTHYVIEVAVAGFTDKEIEVELKENILTVKGEKDKSDKEVEYQYKGISTRSFIRSFPLAEHIEVRGATVKNGILVIALEKVIPEEKKPKKIPISFSESSTLELKAD
jgi:molecular chaperone IbpA